MWYIFSMEGLSDKRAPKVSALPMELINITRLQMLQKLVMAVLFASALPVCSPNASPCISSSSLDLCGHFRYWWAVLWSRPLPVWICSCLLPLLSCMDPAPWLIGAALCCPTFLLCGPAFWLVRAAVSCAWSNHVAPPTVTSHGSVKRQGPPSTHPPASPSQSHALEQKWWAKYFTSVGLHACVGLLIHGTITVVEINGHHWAIDK